MINNPRKFLEGLFYEAVRAADPEQIMQPFIPAPPKGKTFVIGVGKAAAKMAATFEANFSGPLSGLVVCPYGQKIECKNTTKTKRTTLVFLNP